MKKKASSDTKATNTSDPPQPTKRRLAYVGMKDRRVQEGKFRAENADSKKFLVVSSSEAFSIEFGAPAASELQRGVGLKQMEITKGAQEKDEECYCQASGQRGFGGCSRGCTSVGQLSLVVGSQHQQNYTGNYEVQVTQRQ
jgi:hypothetical protein